VPQANGAFVRPTEANKDELPEGFPFDVGYDWLKKIQFGQGSRQRAEESSRRDTAAKALGFADSRTLERAKVFAALPQREQEMLLAESERRKTAAFPVHESRNAERRDRQVKEMAETAPERLVEQRTRSVSVGREVVKVETEEYLREQYTNADGDLFCQVCKARMPFKLDDGSYYFEKVEFLPKLQRRHYQNYLALCPNHAAMFIEANGTEELMQSMFMALESTELHITLAEEETTIKFTKTHIADLKSIIEVDAKISGGA